MPRQQLFDINVQLITQTDRAWYVNDGDVKVWIPKSQCEMEEKNDGTWNLTAEEWILKGKKLI